MKKFVLMSLMIFITQMAFCQFSKVEIEFDSLLKVINKYVNEVPPLVKDSRHLRIYISDFKGEKLIRTETQSLQGYVINSFEIRIESGFSTSYLYTTPPSYYSIIQNIPVLIYTGFENLVSHNVKDIDKLEKTILSYYRKKNILVAGNSKIWIVNYSKGDGFRFNKDGSVEKPKY